MISDDSTPHYNYYFPVSIVGTLLIKIVDNFRVSFTGESITFFFVRGQGEVRRCFSASLIQHHALKTYCGIDVHLSKPSAYCK